MAEVFPPSGSDSRGGLVVEHFRRHIGFRARDAEVLGTFVRHGQQPADPAGDGVLGQHGLVELAEARDKGDFANINRLSKDLAFHTGGHINHSVFWKNLSPDGGDKPEGELAAAIDDAFGSFDAFRAQFSAAALGLQGSGWGFLAYEPIGGNLVIEQLYDQQGNVALGTTPLLMLDMWEHAFYLDYVNVKADYVKAFWNIVNWADVAQRFEAARKNATGLITL